MAVTDEQLRCFQCAAQTLNFTKAAELCFVTQPAFSRIIAALEAEWGVALFERSTRKIRLTQEGEACLKKVDLVLDAFDSLNNTVSRIHQTVYGNLRISFNTLAGPPPWFVSALKAFRLKYPGVTLCVEQQPSHESIYKVQNGELDCALVYEHSARSLEHLRSKRLIRTYRYALIHKDHPLSQKESVSITDLARHTLVFMKGQENHTYRRFHSACQRQEIPIKNEVVVGSLVEMGVQVDLSDGIGITGFMDPARLGTKVKAVPITELNDPEEAAFIALTWNSENSNPAVQWMLELLEHAILEENQ